MYYPLERENNNIRTSSYKMTETATDTKKWISLHPMLAERCGFGATVVGNKIYVVGGFNNEHGVLNAGEVYDPMKQSWSLLPFMKEKRDGCAATTMNGKIYVVGGLYRKRYHTSCEVFDPTSNTWSSLPPLCQGRTYCEAVAVGTKLYVIGGKCPESLSSVEMFDSLTNTWTHLPSMSQERCLFASAVIGNKIYVFGGVDALDSCEVLDTSTHTWTTIPTTMTYTRVSAAAVAYHNHTIYIIGGCIDSLKPPLNTCVSFDVSSNTFSNTLHQMEHIRECCCTVILDDVLYAIGGTGHLFMAQSTVEALPLTNDASTFLQQQQQREVNNNDMKRQHLKAQDDSDQRPTKNIKIEPENTNNSQSPRKNTILERVSCLEEHLGSKNETSSVLESRIQHLESLVFEQNQQILYGQTMLKRIKALEHELLDE